MSSLGSVPSPAPLTLHESGSQLVSSPLVAGLLPDAGEQFDKYALLAKIATGGMAEIFVARLRGAAGFRKNVVIKRILPHVAHNIEFTRMFLDEAKTCAQINHPNVCHVFELCESEGSHFLVLEYLEGATVADLLRRCLASEQQLNLRLAAGIIVQACDGLHAAHEQTDEDGQQIGLVHRDVSPGNLFVTVDGIVKVLDFGIAKASWMSRKTETGTLLGKCEYMSPEQARGGVTLDRRSDVFSLGIAAWELFCGRRLFSREGEYETLRAVLRDPIPRPSDIRSTIPPELDDAILKALERDRDDRYATAHEFRKALADSLAKFGGPTPMCDIAPLIVESFADELRAERELIKTALGQIQTPIIETTSSSSGPQRALPEPPVQEESPAILPPSHTSSQSSSPAGLPSVQHSAILLFFGSILGVFLAIGAMAVLGSDDKSDADTAATTTAVVTTLPAVTANREVAPAATGTLTVSSTLTAKLYLYPNKEFLGTTPLNNIPLPVGNHKIKVESDEGKKYFHVIIESDKAQSRHIKWDEMNDEDAEQHTEENDSEQQVPTDVIPKNQTSPN